MKRQKQNQHLIKRLQIAKKYEAELGWYGLMSRSGKVITPPRYCYITAIGYDLYLCKTDDIKGEIFNGKGVRIK